MLPNDVCRCEGVKRTDVIDGVEFALVCTKRHRCARYLERNTGSERTPHGQYLCDDGDMFILADTLK